VAALTIREAEPTDAVFLADLVDQLGYPAAPDEIRRRMEQLDRDGQTTLVAELDGGPAGVAVIQISPVLLDKAPTCRLAVLVVADLARRQGIGRALVLAVEEEARRSGCNWIVLESGAWQDKAHSFYRSLGYESVALDFSKEL
jgi:GNAT superfamily N-acetyltransferase